MTEVLNEMPPQYIVAHPDTQHSYHAAMGLKRAGMLKLYFTSVSLAKLGWAGELLGMVMPRWHRRMKQHREHKGLEAREIRTFLPHLIAQKMGGSVWLASQKAFAAKAARLGVEMNAGVMAFNTNALWTFRELKTHRLPCVLDQTIAHRRWSNRVGQAECDQNPEWEDKWESPSWRTEYEDEEIALADLILCGSEFCARTMAEEGVDPARLRVVEYGCDTERFRPAEQAELRPRSPRLLFVGSLALRKGFHYLLEAALKLRRLGVRVTMIGGGSINRKPLARYSEVLDFVGPKLYREMPSIYAQHDLYVFPSLVEGSSLSIYEAMAAGLPVITTPNAGSLVRDGVDGVIVPPRNVEALTAALEWLLRDSEARHQMALAARARALEMGDWRHYGQRLARVLASPATYRAS